MKKPTTWLMGVVVAALAAYGVPFFVALIEQHRTPGDLGADIAGKGPLVVLDVRHIPFPEEGPYGYVYRADTDLSRIDDQRPADPTTSFGAVDVGRSTWEVTFVGNRDDTVEIVEIRPVLNEPCAPPLAGILEPNPSEGASKKIVLATDVDKPNPRLWIEEPGEPKEPFFAKNKVTLPKGEKNVIQIRAYSGSGYCKWRLEVQYLANGRRNTTTVAAPGGKPFEVTGPVNDAAHPWVYLPPHFDCRSKDGSKTGRFRITGTEYALMQRQGRVCPY